MFKAAESRYSVTHLCYEGYKLIKTEVRLCKECSDHATRKTTWGREAINRALARVNEIALTVR